MSITSECFIIKESYVPTLLMMWAMLNFFQIIFLFFIAKKKELLHQETSKDNVYFLDDFFFIVWNIFCSVVCIYYVYFLHLEPCKNGIDLFKINAISGNNHPLTLFLKIDKNNLEYIGYIIIISLSVSTQFKNLRRKITYWWYIQKCKICFWIRMFFLIINVFLLAMISWKIVIYGLQILIQSRISEPTVNIFHSDGFGGLSILGHIITISTAIFILRFVVGVVGIFDHTRGRKVSATYIAGDIYNLLYGIYASIGFVLFYNFSSNLIMNEKTKMINIIDERCGIGIDILANGLLCDSSLLNVRSLIIDLNSFPFPLKDISLIVFSALLPIASGKLINMVRERVASNSDSDWV